MGVKVAGSMSGRCGITLTPMCSVYRRHVTSRFFEQSNRYLKLPSNKRAPRPKKPRTATNQHTHASPRHPDRRLEPRKSSSPSPQSPTSPIHLPPPQPTLTLRSPTNQNPLQNGVGAFILQCKRLDFHYCDWAGSSRGMKYVPLFPPIPSPPFPTNTPTAPSSKLRSPASPPRTHRSKSTSRRGRTATRSCGARTSTGARRRCACGIWRGARYWGRWSCCGMRVGRS